MKILFAGTPSNAAETLLALNDLRFEIVGVLTREDARTGRKQTLTESAVAQMANSLGIPVVKANRVTQEVMDRISALKADLGVVVAYGSLLKTDALNLLPKGWVNLHYSLLPDWRGAAPAQRAILAGDKISGVTLFQLDEGLDTGPIWGQLPTEIQQRENSGELIARLTRLGITLLAEKLPLIASGLANPTAQSGVGRTAKKISREEAKIDFNRTATEIENAIRAFNPEPIAFTNLQGETFRIQDAIALGKTDWTSLGETDLANGSLIFEPKRVLVQCASGTLLELKEVQPAGKRPMPALEWARGTRVKTLG